jgi:hypothetical protein
VFRPSVQLYLISWIPIDHAQELGGLTVPVLVVQGTTLVCLLLSRGGVIDRVEGGILLVALVMFIAYTVHIARRDVGLVLLLRQ